MTGSLFEQGSEVKVEGEGERGGRNAKFTGF